MPATTWATLSRWQMLTDPPVFIAGPGSLLHANAVGYLAVRALTAPATVLFLTLQGVFRGLG